MRKHLLLTAFAVGSPFFYSSAFAAGASRGGITISDHASSTIHYATMAPRHNRQSWWGCGTR